MLIATAIFIAGIIIFYVYSLNYPSEGQETLQELFFDGNFITDSLLSEGFPTNWDETNVVRIGILDSNNKINQTKLDRLYNFANPSNPQSYQKTKNIFDTRFNYFFNFTDVMIIEDTQQVGVGLLPPTEPENLIKVSRLTIYKNKPTTLNLQIWE